MRTTLPLTRVRLTAVMLLVSVMAPLAGAQDVEFVADRQTALNPPTDLSRRSGTAVQITCYDTDGNAYQTPFDPTGITLPNPLPVEVTVTWRDDQGRAYSKSTSTLIRR